MDETIAVPKWVIEDIYRTLVTSHRGINYECCLKRDLKCGINQCVKLLKGDEITGRERTEPIRFL